MSVHSTNSIELALNKAAPNANTTTGNGNTQFSVAFWMKVVSGTAQTIITKWDNSVPLGWNINFNNVPGAGTLYFDVYMDDTSLERVTTSGVNVADGNWHQIVCTYDSTAGVVQNIYVDGVLRGTNNDPSPTSVNYDNSIALTMGQLGGFSSTTRIDDARFYQRVLTSVEAMELYSNSEISATSRQAYWPIEAGSGTLIADSSGNGNNLTFNTAPVWSSDVPAPLKNLVNNPGFELWNGGTTFSFDNSTPSGSIADNYTASLDNFLNPDLSAVVSKDTLVFDTGVASCKCVVTDTHGSNTGAELIIAQNYLNNLPAHNLLNFSIRIKADTSLLTGLSGVDVVVTVFNGSTQIAVGNPQSFGAGGVFPWTTISGSVNYTGGTPANVFFHVLITPESFNLSSGKSATVWIDTADMELAGHLVAVLSDSVSSSDSEANQSTFRRTLAEAALAVEDAEQAITARILTEAVRTGEWLDGEKNPAQNVWTTP